jgi:hypothetical protein
MGDTQWALGNLSPPPLLLRSPLPSPPIAAPFSMSTLNEGRVGSGSIRLIGRSKRDTPARAIYENIPQLQHATRRAAWEYETTTTTAFEAG